MADGGRPKMGAAGQGLRVAVLTRTGRPSGARMAGAVAASRHLLVGVIAEKRSAMAWRAWRRHSLRELLRKHGWGFLSERAWQAAASAMRSVAGSRPRGSGAWRPDAHAVAAAAGASCLEVASLNSEGAVEALRDWRTDVLLVANAPVLKPAVFGCCRLMALNFHSGRLPEYGGVASEFWVLYRGEPAGWATIHQVTAELDSGAIVAECPVPTEAADTPETLHARCVEAGARLAVGALDALAADRLEVVRVPGPATLLPWPDRAQQREWRRRRDQKTDR